MLEKIIQIPNFLEKEHADSIEQILTGSNFPFFYQHELVTRSIKTYKGEINLTEYQFHFGHNLYKEGKKLSDFAGIPDIIYNKVKGLDEFKDKNFYIQRAKINCYTRQPEHFKSESHVDIPNLEHFVILYSVNTNNGCTILNTINDCLEKAEHPENIIFGICLQYDPNEDFLKEYDNNPQFRIHKMHWKNALGPAYARGIIYDLFQKIVDD